MCCKRAPLCCSSPWASAVCAILVGLLAARIGSGVARDLRGQVFDKVTSFSNPEFDRFSVSSLITRSTNDITQIQMFCTVMIRLVFYAPIMGVGGILRAQAKSSNMPGMTATIAVSILVMLLLIGTLMAIVIPRFKKAQKLLDRLNLVSRSGSAACWSSGPSVPRAMRKSALTTPTGT